MASLSAWPDRVLVLAPNWLGDVVMALPAIADLRRAMPGATLIVAARPSVAPILGCADGIDEVLPLSAGGTAQQVADLRRAHCGAAVLLPNSFRSAWLVWRAGVPVRAGYRTDGRRLLLTHAVRPPGACHQVEYYQRLAASLGVTVEPTPPRLRATDQARLQASQLLEAERSLAGDVIVCAPGAAFGSAKQWEWGHMASLLAVIAERTAWTTVLVGSGHDAPAGEAILARVSPAVRARTVNLIGRTTLEQLVGVIALSAACVANDSGALHVAAALGVPVVGLFGPTDERYSAPRVARGQPHRMLTHPVFCRPCHLRECPLGHECMKGIAPEQAFAALSGLLA